MQNNKNKNFLKKNNKNLKNIKIFCIGDIILDHYIYGTVDRFSPEAPIPILLQEKELYQLGGVGNVAKNISELGSKVTLLSLFGKDSASKKISQLIKQNLNIKHIKYKYKNFTTPVKTRYINKSKHLIRVDKEINNLKISKIHIKAIIKICTNSFANNDLIILSDYNKGMLDKELIKKLIKLANKMGKMIIADPKKIDLSLFAYANIITPNQKEITDASGCKYLSEKKMIEFAKKILTKNNIKNVLITRSEKGMLLISKNKVKKFRAIATKVSDVTGAGDTVIAILSLMLALGLDIDSSIEMSIYAASIVISKNGTETMKLSEFYN
tara:strand:- start:1261 stop:2238 length:978 start_codon:yes stop_codon:yes gene_type:complete